MQELLESGALSQDDLAAAIESSGVDVDDPDNSLLSFEMVF